MKKLLLSLSFVSFIISGNAQNTTCQNLRKLINERHPEISMENKLIAFNVWSQENIESREANKAFEKTYSVYEHARLKGGSKGMVVVAVNKENLSGEAVITFTKDGISKMISLKLSDLEGLESGTFNGVYDSNGNEIYKNLSSQAIFGSINHLITR